MTGWREAKVGTSGKMFLSAQNTLRTRRWSFLSERRCLIGQYHIPVNLAKRQFLSPHVFNDGLKLLEFGASGGGTMLGLAVLLADSNGRGGGDLTSEDPVVGSWVGDKIVIAGDYGDDGKHLTREQIRAWKKQEPEEAERILCYEHKMPNLYHVAHDMFEDISSKVIRVLCEDRYIFDDFARAFGDGKQWSLMAECLKDKGLRRKLRDRAKKLVGVPERGSLRADLILTVGGDK